MTAAGVVAIIALVLSGCGEIVTDPISAQQARAQVVDAARDIVTALHAELTEATFTYEPCNDQGEPPFRGVADVSFWMPGVPHDEVIDPQTVISALVADGWSTDSDFRSHAPTLRKNNVNAILTVVPPPLPGEPNTSHVGVDLYGQCRDTFDHRTDHSIVPVDISKELQ
jgi:hypothetical protein